MPFGLKQQTSPLAHAFPLQKTGGSPLPDDVAETTLDITPVEVLPFGATLPDVPGTTLPLVVAVGETLPFVTTLVEVVALF
jgi:hypothetical protein